MAGLTALKAELKVKSYQEIPDIEVSNGKTSSLRWSVVKHKGGGFSGCITARFAYGLFSFTAYTRDGKDGNEMWNKKNMSIKKTTQRITGPGKRMRGEQRGRDSHSNFVLVVCLT